MKTCAVSGQNLINGSFQSTYGNEELLARVIESFPYPIQIYSPNGTSVLVNKAMLSEFHVSDPSSVIGRYNIFTDPSVAATRKMHLIRRAFKGETVSARDIKVPLEDIRQRYGV